jgi:hypothetical protein
MDTLHHVLQASFGWRESHLHEFRTRDRAIGMLELGGGFDDAPEDERKVHLSEVVTKEKGRLLYLYDFGDGWEHDIVVEKILSPEPGMRYPICTAGKRSRPPEDCGGAWSYLDLVKIMADPRHPQHADMSEWLGHELEPEAFDLDEINHAILDVR